MADTLYPHNPFPLIFNLRHNNISFWIRVSHIKLTITVMISRALFSPNKFQAGDK